MYLLEYPSHRSVELLCTGCCIRRRGASEQVHQAADAGAVPEDMVGHVWVSELCERIPEFLCGLEFGLQSCGAGSGRADWASKDVDASSRPDVAWELRAGHW